MRTKHKWPWVSHLTPDELAEVERAERDATELREKALEISSKIQPIRSRATQRARRDAGLMIHTVGSLIQDAEDPKRMARSVIRAALMALMVLDGPAPACEYAYRLADEMALAVDPNPA